MSKKNIDRAYKLACERYAELGVNANAAMKKLLKIPVSLHCWQGDDVRGFENPDGDLTGGIQATGNYPGRARTPAELRGDIEFVFSLVGGSHRVNVHSCYAEFPKGRKVDRDELRPSHMKHWIDWAKRNRLGMDFNPTLFSHPMFNGFSLASRDRKIRNFWIRHTIATRRIAAAIGKALGSPCVNNVWIPDGFKDTPADRETPRKILNDSLDACFEEKLEPSHMLDAVESKLFGIGAESYTVGSHEFYMGYAVKNQKVLTLDAGHFHPTETISDKLSACLLFVPEILLHVSRGVRWDSDHVVILNDDLLAIAQELVRLNQFKRVHIGLDYFDASINRIAAWVIGVRAMQKALLFAMLEPIKLMAGAEKAEDFTSRLAWTETAKTLPFGAIWDKFCEDEDVPLDTDWLKDVKAYEANVLARR
ncbi:MAG: L-rhamnose isomerase [Kiritimatiellae bacterium]|nr:L-rhamnose isomerase [Kiritimatiellia bacterium]MDD4024619.1 L-rhamnose isomerase [Kiritimatiellia bacterium]MDD4623384.1 L-rhamnose isomerase [Kiritimatiellia bacterium]